MKKIFHKKISIKKILQEKTFCYLFNALAILMFFVLFHNGLSITGENKPNMDEFIYFKTDSLLYNICSICFSLFCLCFIGKFSEKFNTIKSRNLLLGGACLLSGAVGLYWIFAAKTGPQADQMYLCQYASAFQNGDFSALKKGGYIARYPQQLGMVTLLRIIFFFFGDMNYLPFQCLVAGLIPLLVLSGCQIVRILSEYNAKAELYYLLFILCCFPMYAYIPFVYGDMISTIFCMFSAWMYLAYLKEPSLRRLILLGCFVGLSVWLRQNCLIFLIALLIVTLIKLFFHPSSKYLVLLMALAAGCGAMQMVTWGLYHDVKSPDAAPIPAILYITMGLNDDYQRAGWHNQYEYNTFDMFDDNVILAKEKGFDDLKMYLELYRNDPDYMIDFFGRKMNSQWNMPMYQSLAANNHITGTQWTPARELYAYGSLTAALESGMKLYQLLLYGSILFFLVMGRKKYIRIETYLLLIAVFGGFVFSLIWESKTRYVLPFLFMQIPYMALGVNEIVAKIKKI
ncbi:MAG: hypothetical protein HFH82_03810 [Lachnospiraceae bacterium]|nr:hypothetical protein [Lachnospiraceae bacterium]